MQAHELVNPMVPILKPTDTVSRALDLLQDAGLQQLAVVENQKYVGIFSEDSLLNFADDATLDQLPVEYSEMYVSESQHVYELISFANQYQLSILPTIDDEQNFAGSIVVNELMARFAEQLGVQENGAVVVLKTTPQQYSMAEVSRLVESNNAKILSSYFSGNDVEFYQDATLTLKLNRIDVSAIVATFERFGYDVEGVYGGKLQESLDKNRLDSLLRYLET